MKYAKFALLSIALLTAACGKKSSVSGSARVWLPENRTWRVMSGVSMGGYGAAYLGTKYHREFDAVAVMGGPMDWTFLDHYIETNLMGGFLGETNLNYTFEGWFPGIDDNFNRDEYLELMEDLALAWGNQITYNPKSTFYPVGIDPANATQMAELKALSGATACAAGLPTTSSLRLKNFFNGEYNDPAAPYCTTRYTALHPEDTTTVTSAKQASGVWDVIPFCDGDDHLGKTTNGKVRGDGKIQYGLEHPDKTVRTVLAVDCNGNGRRDPGEPVIRTFSEPFEDCGTDGLCDPQEPGYDAQTNPDPNHDDYHWWNNPAGTEGNFRYDAGEKYRDTGLDGLMGTANSPYDYGEGNGQFDYNPHRATVMAKDPVSLLKDVDLSRLRYYIDAGVKDTFFFNKGAERFAGELKRMGEPVGVYNGFSALSTDQTLDGVKWDQLPKHVLALYGDPALSYDQAEKAGGDGGHVGTATQVVQRVMNAFAWISHSLEGGDWEPVADLVGFPKMFTETSTVLGREMKFGVSLPPGYCNGTEERYPVVYFLHGYGMDPEGLVQTSYLLNIEMANGRLQKMIIVYPDGHSIQAVNGSFFVNHIDNSGQDPFQYEDYYMKELIPWVDAHFRTKAGGRDTSLPPYWGCEIPALGYGLH